VRSGAIRLPRHPDPKRWKEDLIKLLNCLRVVEPKGTAPAVSVEAEAVGAASA
jgi:hypothetical protein